METNTETAKIIKSILADSSGFSCLLILSPDRIRKARIARTLAQSILKTEDEEPNKNGAYRRIIVKDLNPSQISVLIDEVSSLSLFSKHHFILFEGTEKISASISKEILKIMESSPQSTTFVFTAESLPRATSFVKFFKSRQRFLKLPNLEKPEKNDRTKEGVRIEQLNKWIEKEFKLAGVAKWPKTLVPLIRSVSGDSPDKIHSIVEQLALYSSDAGVTEESFHALFEELPDSNDFKFIEALEQKNRIAAEVMLRKIIASGKSPFPLLSLVYRTYSQHLVIIDMIKKGKQTNEIREALALAPWLFNKRLSASKKLTAEKIKEHLGTILHIDSKLKGKSLDTQAVFSELIDNLTA